MMCVKTTLASLLAVSCIGLLANTQPAFAANNNDSMFQEYCERENRLETFTYGCYHAMDKTACVEVDSAQKSLNEIKPLVIWNKHDCGLSDINREAYWTARKNNTGTVKDLVFNVVLNSRHNPEARQKAFYDFMKKAPYESRYAFNQDTTSVLPNLTLAVNGQLLPVTCKENFNCLVYMPSYLVPKNQKLHVVAYNGNQQDFLGSSLITLSSPKKPLLLDNKSIGYASVRPATDTCSEKVVTGITQLEAAGFLYAFAAMPYDPQNVTDSLLYKYQSLRNEPMMDVKYRGFVKKFVAEGLDFIQNKPYRHSEDLNKWWNYFCKDRNCPTLSSLNTESWNEYSVSELAEYLDYFIRINNHYGYMDTKISYDVKAPTHQRVNFYGNLVTAQELGRCTLGNYQGDSNVGEQVANY